MGMCKRRAKESPPSVSGFWVGADSELLDRKEERRARIGSWLEPVAVEELACGEDKKACVRPGVPTN